MRFYVFTSGYYLELILFLSGVVYLQFFDDCNTVDHASVPRKLRSGM